jgi:hypothetical protein
VGPTAGTALTHKQHGGGINQAASYRDVRVLEYSGADTTNPLGDGRGFGFGANREQTEEFGGSGDAEDDVLGSTVRLNDSR